MPSGNSRAGKLALIAGIALVAGLVGFASSSFSIVNIGSEGTFPRPASIEPNIKFWVDVFSSYGERDFVIHDRDQIWRVYQVLHLPGEGAPSHAEVNAINDYLETKYAGILNHLATGAQPLNYEERQVAAMFKNEPALVYATAAQNLRVQQGMREEFREGLLRSRYYRSTMERIFREAGLPPELVTLAEVESSFYSRARSGAGAVGIWQFTRGTGQQFMRITRYHDDRLDPTTETTAAAKLLRSNYLTFGSWPLAITAYNYGTAGMIQAAEAYNGNYNRILQNYNGPHFGFASKNYYAEFLAALQVNQYEDKYFPDLKYAEAPPPPPVRTDFAPRRITRHIAGVHRAVYHHRRHVRRRHHEIVSSGAIRSVSFNPSASTSGKASGHTIRGHRRNVLKSRIHHRHRTETLADERPAGSES